MDRTIPLLAVSRRRELEPYHLFIAASLALSLGAGLVLGILVALSRAAGWGIEASRPDLSAAHGQVQTWGFLGLFVIGMAQRLMPRFSRNPLRFQRLAVPLLILVLAGLLSRVVAAVWLSGHAHDVAVVGAQALLLVAAAYFTLVVWGTLATSQARGEATVWFFLAGSSILTLTAALATLAAVRALVDETRLLPYYLNTAVTYLFLGAFVMAFIGGVGSRALPVMAGLSRSERAGRLAAVVLVLSGPVLAGALLLLEYGVGDAGAASRVAGAAFVGLGLAWGTIVWLSGVLRPAANRLRPASQAHGWLVRSAVLWLALSAALALYLGLDSAVSGRLPGALALDALRHMLGLTATSLIVGMGLLILPEFAAERLDGRGQAARSYVLLLLLNGAAVLRVAPSLLGSDLDPEARSLAQAAAGGLAEVALLVFAWGFLRMMLGTASVPGVGRAARWGGG